MAQPVWVTPAGNLGTIPEGVFYSTPLQAVEPLRTITPTLVFGDGTVVTVTFATQSSIPYDVGTDIVLVGFTPSVYNGSYTVLTASKNNVTLLSTASGTVTVMGTISNTPDVVFYQLIAGNLPPGMQINQNGLLNGIPQAVTTIQGVPSQVSRNVTSKFAIRAYNQIQIDGVTVINRLADRTFELTVSGQDAPQWITPAGQITQLYDESTVLGIQLRYSDADPDDVVEIRLVSGTLPPGLNISSTGLISGTIPTQLENANYEFTLEVTDGKIDGTTARNFSIYLYSRRIMTADVESVTPTSNARMSADNDFLTTDNYPIYVPILLNTPGSIGRVRSDNWFAYKFIGTNLSGDAVKYQLSLSEPPLSELGLTLDPGTGWLYGYIPDLGLTDLTYSFDVKVYLDDGSVPPYFISNPYTFTLTVIGPIDTEVIWITPTNLGIIDNGSTSTLYVEARAEKQLQYELVSGSNSSLPQGLELLTSGEIVGRVSFNTFALDSGATVFDTQFGQTPTTFDMKFTFTVRAFSTDGLISVFRTCSITVNRTYNEPYENLYIQAMPPQNDRDLLSSLLQNTQIFPIDLIYRFNDPNFGIAKNVKYYHAYGLTAATLPEYVGALDLNHYWKNLVLGEIQVAQARDANDVVLYEVVYSRIIDDLVNDQGQSVSKQVTLPYEIDYDNLVNVNEVYPNSLINMRDQVIDTVGQISKVLPAWMTSKQNDGRVLGFVPAWILAYAKPGKGNQIAYYIREQFFNTLNLVDYKVDRYELDGLLTRNWDPYVESWEPDPAQTYFDYGNITPTVSQWGNYNYSTEPSTFTPITWTNSFGNAVVYTNDYNGEETVFDGNSLKFIEPVDMYSNSQAYDKYLVFPKRNILQ
jgi:hypothetical protein